jgi:hypothetical protein
VLLLRSAARLDTTEQPLACGNMHACGKQTHREPQVEEHCAHAARLQFLGQPSGCSHRHMGPVNMHQRCGHSSGRTFEDVEEAAEPGGIFDGHRNNSTISAEAHFSLMHRLVQPVIAGLTAAQPPCVMPSWLPQHPLVSSTAVAGQGLARSASTTQAAPCSQALANQMGRQPQALPPAAGEVMEAAPPDRKVVTCRKDLLETLPAVEVDEMTSAVADALETAAGPGWRLIPVGGGARDIRSHDCDFVVTHDSNKCELRAAGFPTRPAAMLAPCLGS